MQACSPVLARPTPLSWLVVIFALSSGGCPRSDSATHTPPPNERASVVARSATGDFSWTVESVSHPMRSGGVTLGPAGELRIVIADRDVQSPCDVVGDPRTLPEGAAGLTLEIPRGLDVSYPLGRTVSPDPMQLWPLGLPDGRGRFGLIWRYGVEIASIEWRPGGRILGRLAWRALPRVENGQVTPATVGEGRFDLPLCAAQHEIDALAALSKPRKVAVTGALRGRTLTTSLTVARAFADLRGWRGLPPHLARFEFYSDPLVTCATRASARGTTLVVGIDAETGGLGKRTGSRQPVTSVECAGNRTRWECFGPRGAIRGFVEVTSLDLRVGGVVRGGIAIDGAEPATVEGAFEIEICPGS